jgi:type II secretory pathway component PulC
MYMFRYRRKAINYRIMIFLILLAWLPFFGVSSFINAEKASADSEQPKEKRASQESVYTIQTGSFKDIQRAEKQFRIIQKSLEGAAYQALRIEKIGMFYAVRIERFASLAKIEQFFKEHALSLEEAMVMKAYFIAERILLIHDGVEEDLPEGRAGIQRDRYLPDVPYAPNYLGLKLVGTALVDEPGSSIAIIENLASGVQEIYKKGDTLKGVLVKRILRRGVVIDDGRGDEILIMEGVATTRTLQSKSHRIQLEKKIINSTVPTYSAMMRGIGVRTYREEGRTVGFAIYNIKSKSILERMGLQNCDVITAVNGKPIELTNELANFYQTFKDGGEITIDIKRDDINQKLSLEIEKL